MKYVTNFLSNVAGWAGALLVCLIVAAGVVSMAVPTHMDWIVYIKAGIPYTVLVWSATVLIAGANELDTAKEDIGKFFKEWREQRWKMAQWREAAKLQKAHEAAKLQDPFEVEAQQDIKKMGLNA